MSKILNQVSDKEIASEYKKRFFLKSGDKLTGSSDAANHITVLLSNNPSIEQFAVILENPVTFGHHSGDSSDTRSGDSSDTHSGDSSDTR